MITFAEYVVLAEMARPAKSFSDTSMNQAYAEALRKFKAMGVDNANTYIIWDFMFRQLPEFFQQPQFTEARKKASGTNQRLFVQDIVSKFADRINFRQWASDINDESKIRAYLDRSDRGNRHIGRVRADAQDFIDRPHLHRPSGLS